MSPTLVLLQAAETAAELPESAGALGVIWQILFWLIAISLGLLVLFVVVLMIPPLSRMLISGPFLSVLRPSLPKMSATEAEALEAGTVWWDAQIFSGNPDFDRLLQTRPRPLSADEKAYLDGPCNAVCAMTDDWVSTNELGDLAPEVWAALKESGTYGLRVPREHGGQGFSARCFSDGMVKMASRSVALSITAILPNSLGPGELLEVYGTDEQKAHWLPRLASGAEEPAFALTEPTAGSDATGMRSFGVVERGRGGKLQMRLTWDKRYITMSARCTVLGLAFKLRDPDTLLGGAEDLGITVALVPADTPGVLVGERHDPLGVPFINGTTQGTDVVLPLDAIIGGPSRAGQGWRMLMDCLAAGRGIGLPSLATGMAKTAARAASAYAAVRQQFKMPIGRFEGIQAPLARIAGFTYLMDATRQLTVAAIDAGEKPAVCTAIAKYQTTELSRQVVNDAMDIMAGAGISRGPRNPLAGLYAAAPIGITVEGANILTRSLIVFGQGAFRAHPYARREQTAAHNPDLRGGLREFDRLFAHHLWFSASGGFRTFVRGLTRGVFQPWSSGGPLDREFRELGRLSSAFAFIADLSMVTQRGKLKFMEMLSGRLADALSGLYCASAALWRFEGDSQPPEQVPLAQWAARHALNQAGLALHGVIANFPSRVIAKFMRIVAFPTGVGAPPPSDALSRTVAEQMLIPGSVRDAVTAGMYVPRDREDPIGRLDQAQKLAAAAAGIQQRIRAAQKDGRLDKTLRGAEVVTAALESKLVSEEEAGTLSQAVEARADTILVDAHGPDYFGSTRAASGRSPQARRAKTAKQKAPTRKKGAAKKKAAPKSKTAKTTNTAKKAAKKKPARRKR